MRALQEFLQSQRYLAITSLVLFSLVFLAIYRGISRLYFNPLSEIPGPKLAALSGWYQTYYDVYLGGQMTLHIQDLHRQYGPVVRIGPSEVHISDPEFYETIYSNQPFSKYYPHQVWTNADGAGGTTVSHHLFRPRRAAVAQFFSKQAVICYLPEIQTRVSALCDRLNEEYRGTGKPVYINRAIGCLSLDVIIQYCFGRCYEFTRSPDFDPDFLKALKGLSAGVHVFIHFPWLLAIMQILPDRLVVALDPTVASVFAFQKDVNMQAKATLEMQDGEGKDVHHKTVFRELRDSDLPASEKTLRRFQHEAQLMVGGGGDTIKTATYVGIFHLHSNPGFLDRLKEELCVVWPDPNGPPPALPVLEKLPYLSAVILESLRLSYGVAMRLVRISDTPLTYKSHVLPPGTIFSMSCYSMHHNELVFPDSHFFNPSRWLADPVTGAPATGPDGKKHLTRYLASFSKGTRICVGLNLAWAELYLIFASLVRRVEMQLWETDESDVVMVREQFVPWAKKGSKGVRVLIK